MYHSVRNKTNKQYILAGRDRSAICSRVLKHTRALSDDVHVIFLALFKPLFLPPHGQPGACDTHYIGDLLPAMGSH